MSQTLLTSFFTVRKPGSQGSQDFKQNLAEVKKRKREDEEEDDGAKEDPPDDATTFAAGVEEDQISPPVL